ncbi:MAG: hypothetical protein V2J55_10330 [Candidatus Competibacteraceae bacterium]|jgi:hypothetical protein|nr:hypothetical protein [Candidatus Competibacteraceae bacterium]
MSNSKNIPVTLQGSWGGVPMLVVGDQKIYPSKTKDVYNSFWYCILDLSNPTGQPLVNVLSNDTNQPPAEVVPYLGKTGFLLCFAFVNLLTAYMPQGALYQFLRQVGSGVILQRAEQLVEQIGSNVFATVSYNLAATTLDTDKPGFESLDFYHPALSPFQLMPVDVDGKVTYAPIAVGN